MKQRATRAIAGIFACGGIFASTLASAIVPTCVQTAAELQTALTAAATDNQFNYIGVVTSTYNFATPLVVNVTDGYGLTIEGGYAAGCAGLPTPVPDNTIINGANGTNLRLVSQRGGLTVRNLTLSGFKPAAGTNAIFMGTSYGSDTLRIENLSVAGNGVNGINDSIFAIYPAGALEFHDNVVHDNANALAAVRVVAFYADLPIYIANNTVTANAGPGMAISIYSLLPAVLSNNIFWNNGTSDFVVDPNVGNERPAAFNNTWLNCGGCSNLSLASDNNSSADPKLTTSVPKYRLNNGSPAINAGIPVPLTLGALDAAGNARVVGSAPDMGAYENGTNDLTLHTYLVTSNADDAANIFTLRHAITAANAAGVPAAIHFHFTAGCPQVIQLATPLPPITVPMTIDGYSDPGSAVNTAQPGPVNDIPFNATICPVLFGSSSPAPAHALSVSDTANSTVHLEVRGVRFQNFQQAIDLSGGNGHWIHGNAFAGPFLFPGAVLGNGIGVQIDGGFADVVGGIARADVNLIGGSSGSAAVLISGGSGSVQNWYHTVINNSIGGDPTGTTDASYNNVSDGIVLQNSRQQDVLGNWIVANGGDGVVLDGSTNTLVQSNRIGSNINPGLGNAGMGVRVRGGAYTNWIGTTAPGLVGRSNIINNNGGAGVLVDLDAATYNQVTDNNILNNGGLAIDLALLGPTANAAAETGPNRLLHKPLLTSAVYSAPNTIKVSGTLTTSAANEYRYFTFYASHRCGGDAEVPLGTYALQSDANKTINFALSIPQPFFSPAYITATGEDYTAGSTNTSEISNSRRLAVADDIYYDNFDCY
jgi:hypothetical protein